MRATFNIPDDLISEVQKISKEKSKTRAIVRAMEAYVAEKRMAELRALRGKIPLGYDWRREESRELQAQEEREKYLENNAPTPRSLTQEELPTCQHPIVPTDPTEQQEWSPQRRPILRP